MKIFLVGFMGSGKTHWGKRWSQQLDVDFFDLDGIIESVKERPVSEIFEKEGEAFFRQIETTCLRTFSGKDDFIMSCGGGTACFNENMQWMNEQGTTVYLSASPQTIYNRVVKEKEKRPLLQTIRSSSLLSFIEQKLKEREPFYKQAKIIIKVEDLDEKNIPAFIIHHS